MDEAYRKAERDAQSEDIQSRVRFLQFRLRAGELNDAQLWVAGLLGDVAAAQLMGINEKHTAKSILDMLASWRLLSSNEEWELFSAAMHAFRQRLAQILSDEAQQLWSQAALEDQRVRSTLQNSANYAQVGANILRSEICQAPTSGPIRLDTLIEDVVANIWQRVGFSIISIPRQNQYLQEVTQELQQLAIKHVYAGSPRQFCRC